MGLSGGRKLRIAIARALPKKAPEHVSPWAHLKGQVLLGSEAFVATITPQLKTSESKKEISKAQRRLQRSPLKRLLAGVKTRESRNRAIACAYLEHAYTLAEIGREVGLHYATVSRIIKAEE